MRPYLFIHRLLVIFAFGAVVSRVGVAASAADGVADSATGLTAYRGCTLVPTAWADGDSFMVRFPEGSRFPEKVKALIAGQDAVLRLYGADCFETDAKDDSLARRLREQKAHFGIEGIGTAVKVGLAAKKRTGELLGKPFTVHTKWAKAPGRSGKPRFYAFIITHAGEDLAGQLVSEGLARARGIRHQTPDRQSGAEYEARLNDLEQRASIKRLGGWKSTNPDRIAALRKEARMEEARREQEKADVREAKLEVLKVDPNTASPDELRELPGVGPGIADRIIQGRPYANPDDLLEINGIGPATLEKIRPFLVFE